MKIYQKNRQRIFLYVIYATALVTLASCDFNAGTPLGESEEQIENRASDDPRLKLAFALQDSLSKQLLPYQELVGTGVTIGDDGRPVIVVFSINEPSSWSASKRDLVPETARDIRVHVIVTGEIRVDRPLPGNVNISARAGSGEVNTAARFDRPVPIGVSTGHPDISAGTIGARVTDGVDVYALSNNHVYADRNRGTTGDPVTQPGRAENGTTPADDIGTLVDFVPIDFSGVCTNQVDAAIALTSIQDLDNRTPIDGYGEPGISVLEPTSNLHVMKYARTTGFTFGSISAFHVTVEVNYGTDGIACFTDQIIITPGGFSAGGDSGALVVANDMGVENRPVGLLFARSPSVTVANPIGVVLSELGVSFGGGSNLKDTKETKDKKGKLPNTKCMKGDLLCDLVPRKPHELYLIVQDGSGDPVVTTVCAYSSPTSSECGASLSTYSPDFNWNAEVNGDVDPGLASVDLAADTQYVLQTAGSANALYYFWEDGDEDSDAQLTIVSGVSSFSSINIQGNADVALVTATPENVTVASPRWKENSITLNWGSFWDSEDTYPFPDFMLSTVTVKLKDGVTETTLASSVAFDANGNGTHSWTPAQTYTGVQIKIIDNSSGEVALSSSFNVVLAPIDVSIAGPTSLEKGHLGTWSAEITGGTPSFTYDWDYLFICNEQSLELNPQVEQCNVWNQGGTSSSFQKSVSGALFDMRLRLTVTDSASPSDQDTAYLTVNIWE